MGSRPPSPLPDGSGTALVDDLRSLLSTTPFDTVAAVLERSAVHRAADAPVLLAIAAWCEVIRDDTARAWRLAARAVDALGDSANSASSAPVVESSGTAGVVPIILALADVVAALGGSRPFDHESLDLLADGYFVVSDDARRLRLVLAWMLEMPNWYTFADRYADAARLLDARLAALDPEPEVYERVSVWCCLAELEFRRGRWDSARQSSLAAIEAAVDMGDDAGYAHALAARVEAGRSHHATCDQHVRSAWALSLRRGDRSTQWRVIGAEAFAAASASDWNRVRGLLEPLARPRRGPGVKLASVRLWDGDYLESLMRLDDRDAARRHLAVLVAENAAVPTKWTAGVIARIAAFMESSSDLRIQRAQESVATFDEIGAVFEAARSRLILAELQLGAGHEAGAFATLRSAALTFSSLGATAWLEQVDRVASSTITSSDDPPVPEAFRALTRQELEVAMSVIHGATNKEAAAQLFVSVKTIETHMTRILRKLQLRSRAQLAAAYYARTTPTSGPAPAARPGPRRSGRDRPDQGNP